MKTKFGVVLDKLHRCISRQARAEESRDPNVAELDQLILIRHDSLSSNLILSTIIADINVSVRASLLGNLYGLADMHPLFLIILLKKEHFNEIQRTQRLIISLFRSPARSIQHRILEMQKIRLPMDKKIPTNPRFATVETRLNTGRTKDKVLTDQMVTVYGR